MKPSYEELEQKIKELEESKRLKASLLSGLSHDLRTPMNAIIGFTEILTDSRLPDEFRQKYISYINKSGDVLMNLLDDVIDIVKIEAGQLTIQERACSVNKLLSELYTSIEECRKKKGKLNVEIKLIKPTKTESFSIHSDPIRLKQILLNLLNNALNNTELGYIEFGCILKDTSTLLFFVQDTGVGIAEEKLKAIFQKFQENEDKKSCDYSSVGLGLTISKNLVEMLGGNFWTESEIGIGTKFQFTIPYIPVEDGLDNNILKTSMEPNWSDKLILVAEDVKTNYLFIEAALRRTGVKLIWAKDGKQAVEIFDENPNIDMVLMDIQMPEMNGYQATQYMKSKKPYLPVIAQTAYAMAGERELILKAGCDNYISKPFKLNALLNLIKRYMK
ncbi:MAG: response regulator [Saprospiraceae bacterium]|nr:response regulator [Saprospiraceae bacterium]